MPLTRHDAAAIGEILAQAGRAEIMPRFQRLRDGQVRQKTSAFDVVTDADEAAEQAISAALRARFPTALIVGEEAAETDPGLIGRIAGAELAFIIDPIDGTRNFVAGLPLFGVMAAATVRGEVALGAIHDPVCGDTAFALRGEGAWIAGEARPPADLRVAAPVPVARMDAVIGTNFLPEPLRSTVNRNLPRVAVSSWLRCAAH
ncbi:inositol monophosphatase family protein [Inquilinus sp. CA228]|uniref:inositol monophosphatase family protein n=1 Tax=Inquilinus sp. CA228 TaxID=3455609 RepID=UPI003F8CFAC3